MSVFNLFRRNRIDWITLPQPDDSLAFFEAIKRESEQFWMDTLPAKGIYGFQIQQDAKWRPGLTDIEIAAFERSVGFPFPPPLRNFYKTMNGLTKPRVNLYGSSGQAPAFRPVFYSYPDDVGLIHESIDWVCEAMEVKGEELVRLGVSRIFPVFSHRFMLVDVSTFPILSMSGSDVIYYAESLSKLLVNEIFLGIVYNISDFESPPLRQPEIKFWLD